MNRASGLVLVGIATAIATLACSINLPSLPFGPQIAVGNPGQFKIGPEETEALEIPDPGVASSLRLQFAAGDLQIASGGSELLTGTATYNVTELKPIIDGSGNGWTVRTGDVEGFSAVAAAQLVNKWDLTLGSGPLDLALDLGAAKADVELGDLAVSKLDIDTGASDMRLSFSSPNLEDMQSLTVKAGAARLNFSQLANANTTRMDFAVGGGDLTLDFSGDLAQDLDVTITGAAGNFNIDVPEGTAATLTTSGGLISVHPDAGWTSEGDGYTHQGSGPQIHVGITAGAGNVNLRTN
jgi:hypothetical protein